MGKVSMSLLISFTTYQTKCVIKFLFRQLMMSYTLTFSLNQPLKQWMTGKNIEEDENTKGWISWEQKSFLDEIKNIKYTPEQIMQNKIIFDDEEDFKWLFSKEDDVYAFIVRFFRWRWFLIVRLETSPN